MIIVFYSVILSLSLFQFKCCKHSQVAPLEQLSSDGVMAANPSITFSMSLVREGGDGTCIIISIQEHGHQGTLMSDGSFTTNSNDYEFIQSIGTYLTTPTHYTHSLGIGCYGVANIQLSRHNLSKRVVVIRQIDLEALNDDKLEEVK